MKSIWLKICELVHYYGIHRHSFTNLVEQKVENGVILRKNHKLHPKAALLYLLILTLTSILMSV